MLEQVALLLLVLLGVAYVVCWVVLSIAAWPWGILGLMAILSFGLFFLAALRDKLGNSEDARYNDQEEP